MNSIVNNAAQQPCQRAQASDHVLALAWHDAFASQGAVRLRDERADRVAVGAVACAAAAVPTAVAPTTAPKANVVAPVATAVAHIPGSVAWSPPPC